MSLNEMSMHTIAATEPQQNMTSIATNSGHGEKRSLLAHTDGDCSDKRKIRTNRIGKRMKGSKSATTEERLTSASSTNVTDLPFEVLSIILHYTGNYEKIARLGAVCHKFDVVCREVLLSAFSRLRVQAERQYKELESERYSLQQRLESYICSHMHDLSELTTGVYQTRMMEFSRIVQCVFQVSQLRQTLNIVHDLLLPSVSNGASLSYCSELLGEYFDILRPTDILQIRREIYGSPLHRYYECLPGEYS